jgi:molybdopterin biosynthesis enzyme
VGAPLVARLSGASEAPGPAEFRLVRKIASQVGLAEVVPVRRAEGGIEPLGSAPLSLAALARADGWVLVPPESEGFAAGASVALRALP